MLNQAENKVHIEGILLETNIKSGEFTSNNGKLMPYLSGNVKIGVRQVINGQECDMEVPVEFFAGKYTNSGKDNPAYKSIVELRDNFNSVAAAAENGKPADYVRINTASLVENAFIAQDGTAVSQTRINSSFFNKITASTCNSEASFDATICILNMKDELDREGIPTGRIVITGAMVQYGGRIDVINFIVANPTAVDHIRQYWNQKDTVKIHGLLNFTSSTITETEEVGFGEPIVRTRTITKREAIITSGGATGLDGDAAYNPDEIATGLVARKTRMEQAKEKAEAKAHSSQAQAQAKSDFDNLGF